MPSLAKLKACCCGHLQLGMTSLGMAIEGMVAVEVEVIVVVVAELSIICLSTKIYIAVVLLFCLCLSSSLCLSLCPFVLSSFLCVL